MKESKGLITEDPAINLPIGASLAFNPITVSHEFKHNAVWLRDWSSFGGVLLSVHMRTKTEHSVEGSGVIIAPGVALGANHVFEPHLAEIQLGTKTVICSSITSVGLQIWRITHITLVNESDLAIISLQYASTLPANNQFNQASISTRTPKLGEKLMIGGFRASDYSFKITDEGEFACSGNVLVCNGEVTNRFPTIRDSSMLRWPTIEVKCPSWGGMSGGPVFDEKGLLVGLLSSSYDDGPSYVSLLWPALSLEFPGGWPRSIVKPSTILDLDHKLCSIDNRSAIQVSYDKKTKSKNVDYKPWE